MNEFESQNKSGALPPTRVREPLGCMSIVERLATTKPPCRLPVMLDPARVAVPVMNEFESQNKSGALPPTRVREPLGCMSIVERLATTKPPCRLPVMLDPARVA